MKSVAYIRYLLFDENVSIPKFCTKLIPTV